MRDTPNTTWRRLSDQAQKNVGSRSPAGEMIPQLEVMAGDLVGHSPLKSSAHWRGAQGSGAAKFYVSDCTPGARGPKCARTFAMT